MPVRTWKQVQDGPQSELASARSRRNGKLRVLIIEPSGLGIRAFAVYWIRV